MTDYFQGCATPEERKTRFRELAKKHHPDKGGDAEVMKEINSQYERGTSSSGRSGPGGTSWSGFADEFNRSARQWYRNQTYSSSSAGDHEDLADILRKMQEKMHEHSYNNFWSDHDSAYMNDKERRRRQGYGWHWDQKKQAQEDYNRKLKEAQAQYAKEDERLKAEKKAKREESKARKRFYKAQPEKPGGMTIWVKDIDEIARGKVGQEKLYIFNPILDIWERKYPDKKEEA